MRWAFPFGSYSPFTFLIKMRNFYSPKVAKHTGDQSNIMNATCLMSYRWWKAEVFCLLVQSGGRIIDKEIVKP